MQIWYVNSLKQMECKKVERGITEKEIKVKLTKAAITSNDLSIFDGKSKVYPRIPIGMAVGLVSEAPHDTGRRIGERVLISPYIDDEEGSGYKIMGHDIDGVLGDYCVVPKGCVYLLPDGVSELDACFTNYIAIALRIIEELDIDKTQYVVILGSNTLGIILAQLCIYYQAVPIIIDDNAQKLSKAEQCGIYYTINSSEYDAEEQVNSITGGNLADYTIFECKQGYKSKGITNYAKMCGKLAMVSTNHLVSDKWTIDINAIVKKQLKVVGVSDGYKCIDSAINILANQILVLSPLVDTEGEFEDVPSLFERGLENKLDLIKTIINIK